MSSIVNAAAYKFATLRDLKPWRLELLQRCREGGLRGTILLSTEGINLFVAGSAEEVEKLLTLLRERPGLEELQAKLSRTEDAPFRRMLVRIKKEIIAFGVEGIQPAAYTSKKLEPRVLKQWLDEGRPVTLLDTRNRYEVKLGTFRGAKTLPIDHFRQFPGEARSLPAEMKAQPVVMFCTGGIRCEKAGPFLEREGFAEVLQLNGGILKYFEECGSSHFEGECFVFDQRVGVDPALRETESALCFQCLAPLSSAEQQDPRYQPSVSCPHCYRSPQAQRAESLRAREETLARLLFPLPGSVPADNKKPVIVPQQYAGATLLDLLSGILSHVPREEWVRECERGRWLTASGAPAPAGGRVKAGERYYHLFPGEVEPAVNAGVRIIEEDEAIIVLHKPAPLPVHPCGRFHRNTLEYFLRLAYAPERPRPVHRLDANTTGLLVAARTRRVAAALQPQFARGEVDKVYLVRVQGHPDWSEWSSEAPISSAPGEAGSRGVDEEGLTARTEFTVLERAADGTSLLEARPRSGRTNQIRVHLWALGFPVCGDPLYREGKSLGTLPTLEVADPPLCLHAWKLSFRPPLTRERVSFSAPLPGWVGAGEAAS